jgi:hypothetical protein
MISPTRLANFKLGIKTPFPRTHCPSVQVSVKPGQLQVDCKSVLEGNAVIEEAGKGLGGPMRPLSCAIESFLE